MADASQGLAVPLQPMAAEDPRAAPMITVDGATSSSSSSSSSDSDNEAPKPNQTPPPPEPAAPPPQDQQPTPSPRVSIAEYGSIGPEGNPPEPGMPPPEKKRRMTIANPFKRRQTGALTEILGAAPVEEPGVELTPAQERLLRIWRGRTVKDPAIDVEFQTKYDAPLRRRSTAIAIVSFISIMMVIALLQTEIQPDPKILPLRETTAAIYIKYAITITTIVLWVLHTEYYQYKLKIYLVHKEEATRCGTFLMIFKYRHIALPYFFGLVVFVIQPLPNGGLALDDSVALIMIIRLAYVVRLMRDYSPLFQQRRILFRSPYGSDFGIPKFNFFFSLKYFMGAYPGYMIGGMMIVVIFWAAFCIMVVERANDSTFDAKTALYFICVSMTTVGYGDYTAKTGAGRFTCQVAALCGLLISALGISLIASKLAMSLKQIYAVSYLTVQDLRSQQRVCAANMIAYAWRNRLLLRHKESPTVEQQKQYEKSRKVYENMMVPYIDDLRRVTRELLTANADASQTTLKIMHIENRTFELRQRVERMEDQLDEILTVVRAIAASQNVEHQHKARRRGSMVINPNTNDFRVGYNPAQSAGRRKSVTNSNSPPPLLAPGNNGQHN